MPRGATFRTWDDYFIPGTSVLRNKFTAPGKPCLLTPLVEIDGEPSTDYKHVIMLMRLPN